MGLDERDLILKLGELTGAVQESRKSFDEKLTRLSCEVTGIKTDVQQQKEYFREKLKKYDTLIMEEVINRRWVKRVALFVSGAVSLVISVLFKLWN